MEGDWIALVAEFMNSCNKTAQKHVKYSCHIGQSLLIGDCKQNFLDSIFLKQQTCDSNEEISEVLLHTYQISQYLLHKKTMILMIIISNTSILKILTIPILFHVSISICLVFQPLAHQCIFQYFSFISIIYPVRICVTIILPSISLVFHTRHVDGLRILFSENLGYFSHLF